MIHFKEDRSKQKKGIASVIDKIGVIQKAGFGEVRVLIRNGAIYRIMTTEDEVLQEE
jgi:hypothetical protein